ncbi:hypothetical protein JL720_12402 [Aureococcus anophagefferens]|nr:hypothetical protein JL720_12402 [Aureococcus anophagefferens]
MSSRQSWLGALPGAKKVYGGNAGKKKQPAAARALRAANQCPRDGRRGRVARAVAQERLRDAGRKSPEAARAPRPRWPLESSALFVDSSSDEEPKSKGKGLEGAVAAGADEDVAWLREALGAEGS